MAHATEARDQYLASVARMEGGERQRIVIGTGHPGSTCQGAAFEYINNVHKDLVKRGLREKADLLWFSNEPAVGDFGVGGLAVNYQGRLTTSEEFMTAIFRDSDIRWEVQKGARQVEPGRIFWEDYDGVEGETEYDFSMLIPQFTGSPISYVDGQGQDITAAPPRTGMVSGIIGRIVALNVIDLVQGREMSHRERMNEMFAACIASMGDSLWDGSAATILIHPVVPDLARFPDSHGRDLSVSYMEMGLAGAWMKRVLHTTFIWKLKGNLGWKIIPE